MRDTYYGDYGDYYGDDGSGTTDQFGNPLVAGPQYGIPYTSANAPSVPNQGFQYPTGPVPEWQIGTGAGAAPPGAFLPDWRAGQPDQQGATDAAGVPYEPIPESQLEPQQQDVAPPPQTYQQPTPQVTRLESSGSGGGGGGGGGGAAGGGLFNPSLYAPFQGQAPTYQAPTLPKAPSFDDYYNQADYQVPVFQPPTVQAPEYKAPTLRQAPAFEAGRFSAPTLEEAQNQPGYRFGVQEGERALQQSKAAQGMLRTGGTFKDILNYGRNAATQNYGNVFNQNLESFKTNEGGRLDAYNKNYQTQIQDPNQYDLLNAQSSFNNQLASNKYGLDVAQTAFTDKLAGNRQGLDVAQARYAPQLLQYQTDASNAQRQAELSYNANWQKYLDEENVFYQNQSGPFSKYLSLAQLGAANA